jgi:general secretion pathway protein D
MTMKLRHRLASPGPVPRALAAALAATLAATALHPLPALAQKGKAEKVEKVERVEKADKAGSPQRARNDAVTLNFVNAEVEAVSRAMSAIVNRPIVVDPRVKGTMTLYSEQPLSTREAFLNYLASLRGLGFAVVDVAGLLKVVPEAEAKLQTGSVSVGEVLRRGDQIVTQVFRLQHENVNSLVTVLRPLISPNNTINANPGNNSLVITDYADNLQRIAKIIAALDIPATTDVEVVPLRHAVASDMAQMVQRFADSSAAAAVPGSGGGGAVSVLADARTNALLVRAPNAARLAQVKAVIDKLDRPAAGTAPGGNIYVVYLKNADASRLAQVLRAAYSAAGSGSGAAGGGAAGAGGAGSPVASPAGVAAANAATGAGSSTGLSAAATTPVSAAAAPSTGGFIQADPATNSLVISAPEPVYRQLRAVIDQLDTRRAQVYVESMIVKMDAQQAAEFGFQWQGLLGQKGDKYGVVAGTNYGSTGNIVNLSTTTVSSLANTTASSLLGNGLNVGLLKAINGVYTLGALARFLETNTGANVLSTPNLVALDNEEAKIVIGQNVPFITGSYTNTGGSSGSTNPFQTVERKDVGLTLRLKPQVGENGTVRMSVYQENSSVVESTVSNSAGPRTDKSAIETTVVVDDGQIMVLGGLLKDEYADGEDRVPGLASIPLIGNLFRAENRKRIKTNLLVFLRPVVMRTQADANALTLDRYEAIRAQQQGSQPRPSSVLDINESPVLPQVQRPTGSTGKPAMPAAEGPLAPIPWGATTPAPAPAPAASR